VAYVDPQTVHNPTTGTVIPASWGDTVRDCLEFLIDPPSCSVSASGAQSVGTGADTALTADTEQYDNDSMHSTSSNTSRITITTAGRYLFTANVSYASSASTRVLTRFKHTLAGGATSTTYACDSRAAIGGATPDQVSITRSFVMAAGDWMEVLVNQDSGGNLNVTLQEFVALFVTR
jgi:hypothetical protein